LLARIDSIEDDLASEVEAREEAEREQKQIAADREEYVNLVERLREAIRLTREYVGERTLPAAPGGTWFWCPHNESVFHHSSCRQSETEHQPLFRKVSAHTHTPVSDWEPMHVQGVKLGFCEVHTTAHRFTAHPHSCECLNWNQCAQQVTRCSECSEVLDD
jgi:hypothetical protein